MAFTDDVQNKAEELKGKAKEAAGKATGNEQAQVEGIGDQIKSEAGKVGDAIKDAASTIKDKLTGN